MCAHVVCMRACVRACVHCIHMYVSVCIGNIIFVGVIVKVIMSRTNVPLDGV